MSNQCHDSVAEYIAGRVCDRRLMPDPLRAIYAEGLVYVTLRSSAPEAGWQPSEEEAPWDLENGEGVHLQVKQSAAWQSRANPKGPGKPHAMSFDIHPGKRGRQTHIYVFAWHPESDLAVADHRDVSQWRFCVIPEDELPEPEIGRKTQRISLNRLKELAASIGAKVISYNQLATVINFVADAILKADMEDGRLAEEVLERIRRGKEKVYTAEEVRAHLGLDC